MKSMWFVFCVSLFCSCTSKCPCSDEELSVFNKELENHHLRYVEDDEIACKKVDEFWRVSWEPINKQVPVHWDLFFDSKEVEITRGVDDLGMRDKDFPVIKPLLRKLRNNGYEFISISSKRKYRYNFIIEDKDGSFYLSQQYQFKNKQWLLLKTTKSWKPDKDTLDISQLP